MNRTCRINLPRNKFFGNTRNKKTDHLEAICVQFYCNICIKLKQSCLSIRNELIKMYNKLLTLSTLPSFYLNLHCAFFDIYISNSLCIKHSKLKILIEWQKRIPLSRDVCYLLWIFLMMFIMIRSSAQANIISITK